MSLIFVVVLFIILAVDFLIALFGNICPHTEGKDRERFLRLLQRYAVIFGGYTAVGLIAHFCGKYYPSMEYIGGLLLDPIFRYSVSLLDRLKMLMLRPKKDECRLEKTDEKKAADTEAPVADKPAIKRNTPAKAAPVRKAEPVMIEIEPVSKESSVKTSVQKPKAKPRARKATKA